MKKIFTQNKFAVLFLALCSSAFAAPSDAPFSWQTAGSNIQFHLFDQFDAYSLQSNYLSNRDFVSFRRGEVGLTGTFNKSIIFSAWYSSELNTWRQLFLGYKFGNTAEVRAGQFYFTGGFSNNTKKPNLNMPELPAPVKVFSPMYVRGAALGVHYGKVGMSLSAFGPSFDSGYNFSRPYSFVGRWYFSPIHDKQQAFHVGLSAWRVQEPSQMLTFRSTPEVMLNTWNKTLALMQTSILSQVNYYQTTDVELASVYKQLSFMSEYLITKVDRNDPQQNPNQYYDGYYANIGYFLTGESQQYKFSQGSFGGISPIKHNYGAWQLVSQFSSLDLNSHTNIVSGKGGRQNTWSYGVNYFPNKLLKFSLYYIDASATGANLEPYPRQARTFLLRTQIFI